MLYLVVSWTIVIPCLHRLQISSSEDCSMFKIHFCSVVTHSSTEVDRAFRFCFCSPSLRRNNYDSINAWILLSSSFVYIPLILELFSWEKIVSENIK